MVQELAEEERVAVYGRPDSVAPAEWPSFLALFIIDFIFPRMHVLLSDN